MMTRTDRRATTGVTANLVRLVAAMRREGKTTDEVAVELGIDPKQVRSAVANAHRFPTTGRAVKRRRSAPPCRTEA